MDIFLELLFFFLGLVLLVIGGDKFVDEALWIARRFGVPELIIGATIVSIGTTLPELIVSASAAAKGSSDIAFGNAIGSIICNTGLIIGVVMLLLPPLIKKRNFTQNSIFFLIAAAIYIGSAIIFKEISRLSAGILIGVFILYLIVNALQSKSQEVESGYKIQGKVPKHIVYLIICAGLLFAGSQLLIDSTISIATRLNIPEKIIALSAIALGTSLPELVTAIVSIRKGHTALSVGNIIGANLLNIVLVSGVASLILPTQVDAQTLTSDIMIMSILMIIFTIPLCIKGRGFKAQGLLLLAIYGYYIFNLFSTI